jgi:Ca-activated chloride channel homolog
MRSALFIILLSALAAAAQSGRVKGTPTPTPAQRPTLSGPSVLTVPQAEWPKRGAKMQPTPTPKKGDDDVIKVDAALVPIPVSAIDGDGRPLATLKLQDFILKIDGRNADIAEVSRSETPVTLAMLFDNSSSVSIIRQFEKDAAIRLLRRVIKPGRDRAGLFSVADYTRVEQPVTSDISTLVRSIELFPEPRGATALLDGIIQVAEHMGGKSGRRVIVIVSDGEDTYSKDATTMTDVIEALLMNDCQVYVVRTSEFENYRRTGSRTGNANSRTLVAETRMNDIAAQTGGAVYSPINEDEMGSAFTQIASELSQQYLLSYYPESGADSPGAYRTISVAVKGKPYAKIRSRTGYYVPKK